ncbi:class I SAM-dependent methyltransferase [Actinokineospora alba]|uniref:class I SAM-dependent methyltransferase n=1 Tax=Actinokineospora alba TaxID=504798 RepID=UPI001414F638|nr:class I SAM-dependent methyltransferase [Actinokineospora alba]
MTDRLTRWLRAGYYIAGYGRKFPFRARVERIVREWESRAGQGDAPKAQAAWDGQYARGEWDYLAGVAEISHYAVIVGYGTYLKPGGSVLDVGCGEGVLQERYLPHGYSNYVGVDISAVAVEKLKDREDERTAFVQGDAESTVPEGKFDVIVFNESLYYFEDPLAVMTRYAEVLAPDGIFLVSMFQGSRRARSVLEHVLRHHTVLDETLTTQGTRSWRCAVVRPKGA